MDTGVIITVIAGTVILLLVLGFSLWLIFVYQRRYYNHLQEVLSMKERYEQEILKSQLETKEQTMKTISQELHDNIGQVLSLANLQLTAIEIEHNDFVMNKVNKSMQLISNAIGDLRDLARSLNGGNMAVCGLVASVKSDLYLIEKPDVLKTSLKVSGVVKPLEVSKEIIIFRIIQEALNNIIKHAGATAVEVAFNYTQEMLMVTICDNGVGLNPCRENKCGGAGLNNMVTRAQMIHATIEIESRPSEYTKIRLAVPFIHH